VLFLRRFFVFSRLRFSLGHFPDLCHHLLVAGQCSVHFLLISLFAGLGKGVENVDGVEVLCAVDGSIGGRTVFAQLDDALPFASENLEVIQRVLALLNSPDLA
jgi:hypothetical protein